MSQLSRNKVCNALTGVALLGVITLPSTAAAIHEVSADPVDVCAWPNVVGVQSSGLVNVGHCTGVVLARPGSEDQYILTAAHCVSYANFSTGELSMSISFGEDDGGSAFAEVDLDECFFNSATQVSDTYPNAPMLEMGMDTVMCRISPLGDDPPDVPTVPIMPPEGALRDYLYYEIYYLHNSPVWSPKNLHDDHDGPDITTVGTGEEDGDNNNAVSYGIKRALDVKLVQQFDGTKMWGPTQYDYSNTTLHLNRFENSGGEIEGNSLAKGDSGSPQFYRAPDDTWRLVSIYHSEHAGYDRGYSEALPTRLSWIEAIGGDQTPCYDQDGNGAWIWDSGCDVEFPKNMHESTGTWAGDCKQTLEMGGEGDWGELFHPIPDYQSAEGAGNGLWIEKDVLAQAYDDVLTDAISGDFGSSPSEATLADVFYGIGEPVATPLFLGLPLNTGNDAVYLDRVVTADFDGDSTLDQMLVQPMYDCGKGRIIEVIDDAQTVWDRGLTGILGDSVCSDYFGASIATGDFNSDGYDDVAVGVPGDDVGTLSHAGSISVLYGSSTGLTDSGDQLFHQDSPGVGGTSDTRDFLGESMTVGDFDCDGFDDVAIGVPQEDISSIRDAGAVNVIYGSATGLSTVADEWYQGALGTLWPDEDGDRFGASLAAGNFDDDVSTTTAKECDDLAIGAPSEDLGSARDAGEVYVLYGDTAGLSTSGLQSFSQGSGLGESAETEDFLGSVLVAGDTNSDGIDDLRVQAGGEACALSGSSGSSYGHQVLRGTTSGLTAGSTSFVCVDAGGAYKTTEWANLQQLAEHYARAVIFVLENPT